jgi:hypothetical protein
MSRVSITAGTADPYPKCTRFEAILQAMNFRNRGWLITVMQAFGDALGEIRVARSDYDKQVAVALKSTVPSKQIGLLLIAHNLQAREALLEEFARRYVDIRNEFRRFRAASGRANDGAPASNESN